MTEGVVVESCRVGARAWLVLAVVLCAEVMDLLDSTIVTIASPTISAELYSSTTALEWMTGGYSLAFAAFLILGARLGDRFGRRTLFLVGAWGFVVFSALCAVAPTTEVLITSRLLQGATAALLIPQGLGLIQSAFKPEDQGKAFALFGPVVGLAAVVGPVLGGFLAGAEALGGWCLIFLINVPIGIVAAIGGALALPRSPRRNTPSTDGLGAVLVVLAVSLITIPLIQGREAGWPFWAYVSLVAGPVLLGVFALWTGRRIRRERDPLVQPSIFGHRSFVAGSIMTLVFFASSFGVGLALTLYLQYGLAFSAIRAGVTQLPFAIGSSVSALFGANLIAPRLGRKTLQLGGLLQAIGFGSLLLLLDLTGGAVNTFELVAPLLLWGFGVGLIIVQIFDFVLAALREDEVGSGSGVLNSVQQLGTAVGVAVLGTIFFGVLGTTGRASGSPAYISAFAICLVVGIAASFVVTVLALLLPRHARE